MIPYSTPPDSLPPALAARLAGKRGALGAVLLDLARRGIVSIEERKGHWGTRKFEIVRTISNAPLAPHEQIILDHAFRGAASVTLQQFYQRGAAAGTKWSRMVETELIERGLYRPGAPAATRKVRTAAVLLFVAGMLFAPLAFAFYRLSGIAAGVLLVAALAAFTGALSAVVAMTKMSPLTDAGMLAKNRWEGFAEYLRQAEKEPALMPSGRAWSDILPYAAAFLAVASLVKSARKHGRFDVPDWFEAADAGGDDAFYGFIDASSAAAYSGDGGAGSAGASGGGASGAG